MILYGIGDHFYWCGVVVAVEFAGIDCAIVIGCLVLYCAGQIAIGLIFLL